MWSILTLNAALMHEIVIIICMNCQISYEFILVSFLTYNSMCSVIIGFICNILQE